MDSREVAINTNSTIVLVRWVALIIDNILITISSLIFPYFLQMHYGEVTISGGTLLGLVAIALLYILLYFTVTEGLLGYTIGKWICGIRVVREEGTPPGLGKAFIRALFRSFEVYLIGLIGFIAAITSKEKQRLGDIVAKTHVIYSKDIEPEQRKLTTRQYLPCGLILCIAMTVWVSNIINIGFVWAHPTAVQESTKFVVSPNHISRLKLLDGWSEDTCGQ